MMYPYMILADETEITHSQIIEENGKQCVEVHFERPKEGGFDTARCSLKMNKIFSDKAWVACRTRRQHLDSPTSR